MTLKQLKAQQAEARRMLRRLAKIMPGAFDKHGRPLVATLRLLPQPSTQSGEQQP